MMSPNVQSDKFDSEGNSMATVSKQGQKWASIKNGSSKPLSIQKHKVNNLMRSSASQSSLMADSEMIIKDSFDI